MSSHDARDTRAMEAFFIHPTSTTQYFYQRAEMIANEHLEAIADSSDALELKVAESVRLRSKTAGLELQRPLYWPSYTSDEEVASPVDADDSSTHSNSEFSDSSILAEALADDCDNVQHQCSRARSVTLKQVKPRIIAVVKPADITTCPRLVRAPETPRNSPPLSRLEKDTSPSKIVINRDGDRITSKQPIQRNPHSSERRKSANNLRSVPVLEAAARAKPTQPSEKKSIPPLRRMTSIMFTNNGRHKGESPTTRLQPSSPGMLSRMNRLARSSMRPDVRRIPSEPIKFTEAAIRPATASGEYRHKLVARGANERAPTLVLPPFPDGKDEDSMVRDDLHWPERTSSALPMHLRRIPVTHRDEDPSRPC